MKRIEHIEIKSDPLEEDMLPEYAVDFSKAKPNRFASGVPVTVILDADVARVFSNSEAVNTALRAILRAIPHQASA